MEGMFLGKVNKYEYGIVNLGSFDTNRTHSVFYYKNNKINIILTHMEK